MGHRNDQVEAGTPAGEETQEVSEKKILTICSAGTVRSVGMAHLLKHAYEHDAVPVGADANNPKTIAMLSDWADLILPMQPEYARVVPEHNRHKTMILDVGPDIWGSALHPNLQVKLKKIAMTLREKNLI